MFKYAQLNDKNVVIGISQLKGDVLADNMILINEVVDVDLGYVYDTLTMTFSTPEPQTELTIVPTTEEKILAETQYQTMLLELNTLGGI